MADDTISLSKSDIGRLLAAENADAALLWLYLGVGRELAEAQQALSMNPQRYAMAEATLRQLGLWPEPPRVHLAPGEAPAYSQEDVTRELRGNPEFPNMVGEAQRRLGRLLTTEELKILLSIYRYLGLSPEVISILISYCVERQRRKGSSRPPSIRTIEKEAYRWSDNGIDSMETAAAYMQQQLLKTSRMSRLQELLGIEGRSPTAGEERYLAQWAEWGFSDEIIQLAYDKTCLNTGGLKWPYMNKILSSWQEKGLLTVQEIAEGDRAPQYTNSAKKAGYNAQHHTDALSDLERAAIEQMMNGED